MVCYDFFFFCYRSGNGLERSCFIGLGFESNMEIWSIVIVDILWVCSRSYNKYNFVVVRYRNFGDVVVFIIIA